MDGKTKFRFHWLVIFLLAGVALYGCWQMLKPFVGVLTWAIVLVIIFHPLHERLFARTGRPVLSALASSTLVVLVVLIPLLFVVLTIGAQLPQLAQTAMDFLNGLLDPEAPMTGAAMTWLGNYINLEELRSQFVGERMQEWIATLGSNAFVIVGGLFGIAAQALFVIFTMYYLFRDGEAFVEWLQHVLPLEEVQSEEVFKRTREMIEASVYGVVVLALVQGALGGLAFLVLGLDNWLVWGAVMAFLSMIPVAGSFFVWVPAAIYLAAQGSVGKAILLTLWGSLVIGLVDNLARPKLMGQKARMHELFLFFGVLGGLAVFGVAGIVLGPVLVAVTLALFDVIRLADRPVSAIKHEPGIAEQTARISDAAEESAA